MAETGMREIDSARPDSLPDVALVVISVSGLVSRAPSPLPRALRLGWVIQGRSVKAAVHIVDYLFGKRNSGEVVFLEDFTGQVEVIYGAT